MVLTTNVVLAASKYGVGVMHLFVVLEGTAVQHGGNFWNVVTMKSHGFCQGPERRSFQ